MQENLNSNTHVETLKPSNSWSHPQQNSFNNDFNHFHPSDDDSSFSIPNSDVVEALLADNEGNHSVRLKDLMLLQNSFINRNRDKVKEKDKKIKELEATIESLQNRLKRMERRIVLKSNKNVEQENEHVCKRCRGQLPSPPNDNATVESKRTLVSAKVTTPIKFEKKVTSITRIPDAPSESEDIPSPKPAKKPPDTLIDERPPSATGIADSPVDHVSAIVASIPSKLTHSPVKMSTDLLPISPVVTPEFTNCVSTVVKYHKPISAVKNFFSTAGHESMYLAAGVCNSSELSEVHHSSVIMKTRTSYHKHLSNPPDELEQTSSEDLVNSSTVLKLPTWKIKHVESNFSHSNFDHILQYEPTENDAYFKRHSKFEAAEKRRKRWDIQRIREWRYNEKLRQKLLKNDPNNASRLESFYPCVWDMQSIHIDDSLPVTVFGRVLPLLTPSEFNLPSHLQSAPS